MNQNSGFAIPKGKGGIRRWPSEWIGKQCRSDPKYVELRNSEFALGTCNLESPQPDEASPHFEEEEAKERTNEPLPPPIAP